MRRIITILWTVSCVLLAPEMVAKGPARADSLMKTSKKIPVKAIVVDGDTIPQMLLNEVTVMEPWRFKNKREEAQYSRLVRNIKITLPYARMAAAKLQVINDNLAKLPTDKKRREYLKKAEKELFDEFEAPLRKLTFSQGKLLIKLIDRETGDTSYNLIREYKGGVSALFWQGIARIFGANLKDQYIPSDRVEDRMIEHIIALIDIGVL
ncbi:DUF4294 domain-containing protein [Xiashengella succiniciproducens]|jgi:hypothetical protein|uniref:DUF4294 domain-containing protein n=1 Tax=Xiashengella succiniciproducens TaxID=2949635 RepID=A0A9J6ZSF4_9BACT|nr:DUF4294 domain-containing protein [Alkaliflexus sp. Ai-910]URW80491.1 DUF4294 domain-containing protein [Alkaliflexus sp. Ai-910]